MLVYSILYIFIPVTFITFIYHGSSYTMAESLGLTPGLFSDLPTDFLSDLPDNLATDFTAIPLPELPTILVPFQISAPLTYKGGDRIITEVIQYPTRQNNQELEKGVVDEWNRWWSNTTWAQGNPNNDPRWNSNNRSSEVWSRFGQAAHVQTGHPYVFCLNCGLLLQHPTPGGIGIKHLNNHRRSKSCQQVLTPLYNQQATATTSQPRRPPIQPQPPVYSTSTFDKELLRVIIANNWSFRTVERHSFQRFIQFLRPETVINTRYYLQQTFKQEFEAAQLSQLRDIGNNTKLSLALDAWSANNHLSFLAIKGYYINSKWQLQEPLLEFSPLRGRHTGYSMATEVLQLLSRTGQKNRLLAITSDNASNNNTLTQSLEQRLGTEGIKWDASENSVPCLAHIINLVVQEIIQHLKLAATTEAIGGEGLQKYQVEDIEKEMSVPNSLRKVCIFITVIYHRLITIRYGVYVQQLMPRPNDTNALSQPNTTNL